MESVIPGLTCGALLQGSAYTGLPISFATGLSTGHVEIWVPSHDTKAPLFRNSTRQSLAPSAPVPVTNSPITRLRTLYPHGSTATPVLLSTTSSGSLEQHVVVPDDDDGSGAGSGVKLDTSSHVRVHGAAANDLAVAKETPVVATCGEDGVVNVVEMAPEALRPVQSVTIDSATLHGVAFLDQNNVVAVGSSPGAQMIFYDMRNHAPGQRDSKVTKFGQIGKQFCSVGVHSSRPDRVCTGANDGSLSIWDRRTNTILNQITDAHAPDVMLWNLCFHPTNPNMLLSSGEDGLVQSYDISHPDPASTKTVVYSTKGLAIHSLDTCYDDLAGEIVMIGSDDECLVMEQLHKIMQE